MAITDEPGTAHAAAQDTHFCPQCGHQTANGRFCPGCGADLLDVTQPTMAGPPPPPPHMFDEPAYRRRRRRRAAQTSATRQRPNSKLAVIVAAGALGLAAVVAAVIIILSASSSNTNSTSTYTAKLSSALAPVLAANTTLSQSFQSLSGKNTQTAKTATSQAQQAITQARGAVVVLTVPASEQQLSQQVQQALAQETNYLGAVQDSLNNPSTGGAQLQALAGNTGAALVPLNAVAPGIGTSLNATDALASWAAGQARAQAKASQAAQQAGVKQAAKTGAQQGSGSSGSGSSSGSSSGSGGSSPAASSTDCGGGVMAGPNTSCPFALNVHQAWMQAPGVNNTVQAFSPVTNQTYTMTCSQAGSGITCSGANNASVSWQ